VYLPPALAVKPNVCGEAFEFNWML